MTAPTGLQPHRLHELAILATPGGPTRGSNGGFVLTQKYVDGVLEYCKHWQGQVTVLVCFDDYPTTDMDRVEVLPGEHPFRLEERPTTAVELKARLAHSALALAFLSREEAYLSVLCHEIGVPLVYISEYSLRTDWQIIDTEVQNSVRRAVRKVRAWVAHRARVAAVRRAAGIQCSGTPTYDIYRRLNPNALLFIDNRVRCGSIISMGELEMRTAGLIDNKPLRLVFGGRLVPMKGVLHLPLVARQLVRLGVPFTLDIFGTGPLESMLRDEIARLGLAGQIRLRGVADFAGEWIPMLKREADIFVCCHPQGDPSSTYSEVMACGVPIAGYANEAFEGVVRLSHAGWLSPVGQPDRLAEVLARLNDNRAEVIAASARAVSFAAQHSFEITFARRIDHLASLTRNPAAA